LCFHELTFAMLVMVQFPPTFPILICLISMPGPPPFNLVFNFVAPALPAIWSSIWKSVIVNLALNPGSVNALKVQLNCRCMHFENCTKVFKSFCSFMNSEPTYVCVLDRMSGQEIEDVGEVLGTLDCSICKATLIESNCIK